MPGRIPKSVSVSLFWARDCTDYLWDTDLLLLNGEACNSDGFEPCNAKNKSRAIGCHEGLVGDIGERTVDVVSGLNATRYFETSKARSRYPKIRAAEIGNDGKRLGTNVDVCIEVMRPVGVTEAGLVWRMSSTP